MSLAQMVDQVLADGVVSVHEHGHLEFGAHAVDARDENGVAHPGKTGAEEAAKAADFAENFGRLADLTRAGRPALTLFPRSTSTPARA